MAAAQRIDSGPGWVGALGGSVTAGAHPATMDEGRAFLQRRLALLGKITFFISVFFFVFGDGLATLYRHRGVQLYVPTDRSLLWHLAGALVSLSLWVALRDRRRRFSAPALVIVDVAAMMLALAAYALMYASGSMATGATLIVARTDLLMLLVTVVLLIVRAVIVPCTVLHSALVSVMGIVPAHALSYWMFSTFPIGDPPLSPLIGMSGMSLWSVAGVMLAVETSRVIYGLRAQVVAARRLGQYVLDGKIGEGGMGTVYRASHVLLRRPTALKLLRRDRAGADTLSRFEREVQLTSRLSHPNTVAIFDYGHTPDGVFYYAMEYLEGIDLERLVATYGRQPPARVIHILQQVCGSLAEAHGVGLVHRDIKPSNIMLCERGGMPDIAKVVDFGLAKEVSVAAEISLTAVDAVIGTPLYMPPEVIRDPHKIDARADLYALGAVAYYLLAGEPVFAAARPMEVCASHLRDVPVPLAVRAPEAVPPELDALVLRCLAKDPADRPQTANDLRDALLACAVPAWTERDARAWWAAHHARPAAPSTLAVDLPGTMAVDMFDRAPVAVEPRVPA